MRTKLIIILIAVFSASYNVKSQKEERIIIEKHEIVETQMNGELRADMQEQLSGYIILYKTANDDALYFANVSIKQNSESYGIIDSFKKRTTKDADGNSVEVLEFNWHYINSYDDVTGVAKVQIVKIDKQETVATTVKIIAENFDILIYQCYLEQENGFLVKE